MWWRDSILCLVTWPRNFKVHFDIKDLVCLYMRMSYEEALKYLRWIAWRVRPEQWPQRDSWLLWHVTGDIRPHVEWPPRGFMAYLKLRPLYGIMHSIGPKPLVVSIIMQLERHKNIVLKNISLIHDQHTCWKKCEHRNRQPSAGCCPTVWVT